MTADLSIQNKQKIYVDSAQNVSAANSVVGNHLANGTAGITEVEPISNEIKSKIDDTKQKTIDKAILDVIKGTSLTLEEAKKMLEVLNNNKSSDLDNKLKQALNCLKYAIEDCTFKGKLDKEKLQKVFGCYVLMTMTPDKKQISCDEARKVMNMSLVQFVTAFNPALKGKKDLSAKDVKDSLKVFIKHSFFFFFLEEFKNAPESAKNTIKSLFGTMLDNCKPEELNLLFEAFVMLLQDEDIAEHVPALISEVCENLKNDKTGRLKQFLTVDLEKILLRLGFEPASIEKLKQFGLMKNINADNIEELMTGCLKFLQNIKPAELTILLEALDCCLQGKELTEEQAKVLNNNKDQLNNLITVIGSVANNPELIKGKEELFNKIQKLLGETKLDLFIYSNIQNLFNQFPELFENCKTHDDLAKVLNKLTDNKYSQAVGDKNPDNLYCPDDSEITAKKTNNTTGIGLEQRTTQEEFARAYENVQYIANQVDMTEEKPAKITFEPKSETPDSTLLLSTFTNKSQIREYLKTGTITVGKIIRKCDETKGAVYDFVTEVVDNASDSTKAFYLNMLPAFGVVTSVIEDCKIKYQDLKNNVKLDFNHQKKLENDLA